VDAGHANVEDRMHFVAHCLGGDLRLLGHEDVAGAGADHGDLALAVDGAVPPHADGARQREVLGVGAAKGLCFPSRHLERPRIVPNFSA
jgi:hypothetical protein